MQLSDRFTVSEDVVVREVSGELVLLDLGLDAVGARIWELLADAPRDLGEICDTIESEFDAPRERIEADLIALVKQLQEQELIAAQAA